MGVYLTLTMTTAEVGPRRSGTYRIVRDNRKPKVLPIRMSSINFCEPDYLITAHVAEFHNAWSSLLLVYMGYIGYRFGDPLNQWKNKLMFLVLGTIGVGSTMLHSSLSSHGQALDELPMLFIKTIK